MKIPSSAWSITVVSHAFTVLAALVAAPTVHADCPKLIRVPEDAASINAAVAQVCAGTTAEIVVGPGTWTMAIPQLGGTTLTIRGAGQSNTTITQTAPGVQFNPRYGARVSLNNLTVADAVGYDDIGWNMAFDNCLVRDCNGRFVLDVLGFPSDGYWVRNSRFERCQTYVFGVLYGGGGVIDCTFVDCMRPIIDWGAGPPITNCTFTRTITRAIEVRSDCSIVGCTFDSTSGRAIEWSPDGAPTLSVANSTFTNNNAGTANGAAIFLGQTTSTPTLTDCTFTGNSAASGGAIYSSLNQALTISGCTFTGNSATAGSGGAIAQQFKGWNQQFAASNCSFVGNTATGDGGALKLSGWSGNATLSNCSFQSNSASGYGGAVNVDRLSVSANNCEFLDNTSAGEGGAYFQFIGTTSLHGCLFGSNSAARTGAVHLYYYNNSQIQSCTFTNNTAGHWGTVSVSGSYCSSAIDDCIFAGNSSADVHALAVFEGEGTSVTLSSTSICGGIESAWFGPVTDGGGNCVVESCADTDTNGIPDECQVVSVPGEYKTIQDAIDTTPKGEFRIVSVAAGTYTGPFALGGKDVLIRGAGAATTVLQLDGQTLGSVVRFDGGESSSSGLDGVTVRGAISGSPLPSNPAVLVGGGVIGLNSAAGIRNCVIESNVSSFGGGAYLLGCTSVIENTVFRNNIARADGGAAQFYGGAITMNGCTVTDNLAVLRGGGLHIVLGNHVVSSTTVSKNHSNDRGGGLSWAPVNSPTASLDLISCDIEDNTAFFQAGGILADTSTASPSLAIETSSVCGNLPRPNIVGPHDRDSATVVCDCFGDLSEDGVVNGVDVAIILSVWGTDGGGHPEWDVTRDGMIDGADLAVVLSAWGECAP